MVEKWTGKLIGKMHNNRVSLTDVAQELGVTKAYVSMILNGTRKPPEAQRRLETAVDAIIARKKSQTMQT